jgi:hypothetical protein
VARLREIVEIVSESKAVVRLADQIGAATAGPTLVLSSPILRAARARHGESRDSFSP